MPKKTARTATGGRNEESKKKTTRHATLKSTVQIFQGYVGDDVQRAGIQETRRGNRFPKSIKQNEQNLQGRHGGKKRTGTATLYFRLKFAELKKVIIIITWMAPPSGKNRPLLSTTKQWFFTAESTRRASRKRDNPQKERERRKRKRRLLNKTNPKRRWKTATRS